MNLFLQKMISFLPSSWKGYLSSAVAGYLASSYGPQAAAAFECIKVHFGF